MNIHPHEDSVFYDELGMRIWEKRHAKVSEILGLYQIKRVADLGCNEGKFIRRLTRDERYDLIIGVDCDKDPLQIAETNSSPEGYHRIVNSDKETPLNVLLFIANLTKDCSFLRQYDLQALTLIELIEHIEIEDLRKLEMNVFGVIAPDLVIVTTPNYEFNRFFEDIEKPAFRHDDHKFEMTQAEFKLWADSIAQCYGYNFILDGVGLPKNQDTSRGFCSQIAIFEKNNSMTSTLESSKSLEPQNQELFACIVYPERKRKDLNEDFRAELNHAYYFVLAYSNPDDSNEEDDYAIDGSFVPIVELLKMEGLKKIFNNENHNFFEVLEKSLNKEEYEVDVNRKKIKLITKEEEEEEEMWD